MINLYSAIGHVSPARGSEDPRPRYKSYQEEFEHAVMIYYNWWEHRHEVTIESILWILGLSNNVNKPSKDQLLDPASVRYEAAISALRMHGVDIGYDESGKLVRYN